MNFDGIQGRYLSDLLDQPRALRATLNALRETEVFDGIGDACDPERFQRVVLTGMGSSYFGLHPLAIELARNGWTPLMLETSELIYYYAHLLTPSTLVVAVSQSGKSVEMVRLLERNAGKARVIGVTNHAESPLAQGADFAALTAAGDEYSVSCKTYVAAQMALSVLGAALCKHDWRGRGGDLEEIGGMVEGYLGNWRAHVEELAEVLRDSRDLFLVGRGASVAAASTGALIIKESAHFHAEGMSSAAFRHGPFDMLKPGLTVCVFAGDGSARDLNEGLVRDIEGTPGSTLRIAADAEVSACRLPTRADAARPIAEILPVQMMTLALAALGGRRPGEFERATKVTAVE